MSTASFTGVHPFAVSDAAAQHIASVGEARELPVRRRANVNQAHAIEKLGHAVDHLIYSRMFLTDPVAIKSESDAIHILMVSRRKVFEECEKVAQGSRQVKQWIMERVRGRSN